MSLRSTHVICILSLRQGTHGSITGVLCNSSLVCPFIVGHYLESVRAEKLSIDYLVSNR